jgi:aspartoacylase
MIIRSFAFFASVLHASGASSPFSTPVKTVSIIGGTHGNEYTGIWCIKAIEKQRELFNEKSEAKHSPDTKVINVFKEYPTLSIDTLLANPKAYLANRRFIDTDMNREFSIKKLQQSTETCSDAEEDTCESQSSLPYEAIRAKEIESMFGAPKTGSAGDANADIVIDLHTTTANMGITLIVTEGDALMSAAAAYALHKCKTEYGYQNVHILLLPKTEKHDRTHLPSIGKHDFTIEVGPTPQGVIRVS